MVSMRAFAKVSMRAFAKFLAISGEKCYDVKIKLYRKLYN